MNKKPVPIFFEFSGSGPEYFRIWIVNLFLSVITLGTYSAWAKVRRLKYFYNNTELDGAIFDYHANPKAILHGRLIAVPVLTAIYILDAFTDGIAFPLACLMLGPWIMVKGMRFNASNTSYRGLRFRFVGNMGEAYRIMSLEFFYVILTAGLLFPLWHYRFKRYVMSNLRYGDKAFQFGTPLVPFMLGYAVALGAGIPLYVALSVGIIFLFVMLVTSPLTGAFSLVLAILAVLSVMALLVACVIYLMVRNRNLVFNHLGLGPEAVPEELEREVNPVFAGEMELHRFISSLRLGQCFAVWGSNFLLTVLTLGLFRPFAAIRNMSLLADNTMLVKSPIQDAATTMDAGSHAALAEEASDTGGMDIGL